MNRAVVGNQKRQLARTVTLHPTLLPRRSWQWAAPCCYYSVSGSLLSLQHGLHIERSKRKTKHKSKGGGREIGAQQ